MRTSTIPWAEIQEAATREGLTTAEIAVRFNVKAGTVQKRIDRGGLTLVSSLIPKMQQRLAQRAAEKVALQAADDWLEKGERHRKVAYDLGHESLKKMKPRAPKNFREAEACDKIVRRAAGLDVADTVQQTLISINEAMNEADAPRPIEAEVVESDPANQQPESPALNAPESSVAESDN